MSYLIGGADLLNKEDYNRLTQIASQYELKDFYAFAEKIGYEQWMNDFCDDPDGPITDADNDRIEKTLQEVFDAAHEVATMQNFDKRIREEARQMGLRGETFAHFTFGEQTYTLEAHGSGYKVHIIKHVDGHEIRSFMFYWKED